MVNPKTKSLSETVKRRVKRHLRVRKKIKGTTQRPRLAVFKSNKYLTAQVIDDDRGVTIAYATTMEPNFEVRGKNMIAAAKLGEVIAKRAIEKGVTKVVFDRGGFLYHGKVAALAQKARQTGLEF
jgi:large subunit ribosomal protein L18